MTLDIKLVVIVRAVASRVDWQDDGRFVVHVTVRDKFKEKLIQRKTERIDLFLKFEAFASRIIDRMLIFRIV